MTRRDVDRAIAELAAKQWHAFSLAQVFAAGGDYQLARRRRRAGGWREVEHNVFVLPGAKESWKQRLSVATLGGGPNALASHRAAGALQRVSGFAIPPPIEISIPYGQRYMGTARCHLMSEILPADITSIEGIACTSLVRTLIDAAWYLDPATFEVAVEDARHRHGLRLSKLVWRFNELTTRGRPGAATIRQYLKVMQLSTGKSKSELETRFDQIARWVGLGDAKRNVPVTLPNRRHAEIDRFYPLYDIAVEIDGDDTHGTRIARIKDKRRQNQLYLLDRYPLRFSYWDLYDDVDETIAVLNAAKERKRQPPAA